MTKSFAGKRKILPEDSGVVRFGDELGGLVFDENGRNGRALTGLSLEIPWHKNNRCKKKLANTNTERTIPSGDCQIKSTFEVAGEAADAVIGLMRESTSSSNREALWVNRLDAIINSCQILLNSIVCLI